MTLLLYLYTKCIPVNAITDYHLEEILILVTKSVALVNTYYTY